VKRFKQDLLKTTSAGQFCRYASKKNECGAINLDQQDSKSINPYGDDKDFAACAIFGMMNTERRRFGSKDPVRAMTNMHDRGNGLGGGFAVYGIYPDFKDYYAFHVMYLSKDAKEKRIYSAKFDIVYDEEMQTKPANVRDPPVWRYLSTKNNARKAKLKKTML
jgi:glutamate synthase domain-containing protein 1